MYIKLIKINNMAKRQIEITVKFKLPEKLETELENLATITNKPKEFHFKEALIRYIEDMEEVREVSRLNKKGRKKSLTVELPKEWADHLENLEKTTSKKKDYYVREALYRHLEDLEDLQTALKILKSKTLSKTITDKELVKKFNSWWPTTTN